MTARKPKSNEQKERAMRAIFKQENEIPGWLESTELKCDPSEKDCELTDDNTPAKVLSS